MKNLGLCKSSHPLHRMPWVRHSHIYYVIKLYTHARRDLTCYPNDNMALPTQPYALVNTIAWLYDEYLQSFTWMIFNVCIVHGAADHNTAFKAAYGELLSCVRDSHGWLFLISGWCSTDVGWHQCIEILQI